MRRMLTTVISLISVIVAFSGIVAMTTAPAEAATATSLAAGQTLNSPDTLTSPDGFVTAAVQNDGNFVVYAGGSPIWQSHTSGNGSAHLAMQSDGNLVLYSASNAVLWQLGTNGSGAAKVVLQDDGNLVALNAAGAPVDSIGVTASSLSAGAELKAGQSLYSSDHLLQLAMQSDGNLVIYQGTVGSRSVLWQSQTNGQPGARLAMQSDGNLVIYSSSNKALWSLASGGSGATRVVLQDDGNLVELNGAGKPVGNLHLTADTLAAGQTLLGGQSLTSADRSTRLVMQGDGNAVLYGPANGVLWQTRTNGHPGARLVLQTDGNMVVYAGDSVLWQNAKNGSGSTNRVVVQNDHNLVEYQGSTPVWFTATNSSQSGATAGGAACGMSFSDLPASTFKLIQSACRVTVPSDPMYQYSIYAWNGGHGATPGPTYGSCSAANGAPNDCNVKGFDCSGLVRWAYYQATGDDAMREYTWSQWTTATTTLPHQSVINAGAGGRSTNANDYLSQLRPGDLLFYGTNANTHVAIYLGNGKQMNAYESGTHDGVTSVWSSDLWGAVRLW